MNKKIFFYIIFIIFSSTLFAQQKDDKGVYLRVEKMPVIEGGMAAIGKKVRYPKEARSMGLQGVVVIGFIVDEKGKATQAKILKGVLGVLDKEALRVVTKEVKFTPGYHEGVAVPVRMVLPIRFKL
jgi:protein TonB